MWPGGAGQLVGPSGWLGGGSLVKLEPSGPAAVRLAGHGSVVQLPAGYLLAVGSVEPGSLLWLGQVGQLLAEPG